jgi:hypothetical protein
MLRNVTQDLNRLDTYVSEQFLGYYLTPTAEEYDALLAIVADLEEELMGNPNTIWGYNERFSLQGSHTLSGDSDYTLIAFTVPAGYVYVVEIGNARDIESIVTQKHFIYDGTYWFQIGQFNNQPAGDFAYLTNMRYTLAEGDQYAVQFMDAKDSDRVYCRCFGYKMKVP